MMYDFITAKERLEHPWKKKLATNLMWLGIVLAIFMIILFEIINEVEKCYQLSKVLN